MLWGCCRRALNAADKMYWKLSFTGLPTCNNSTVVGRGAFVCAGPMCMWLEHKYVVSMCSNCWHMTKSIACRLQEAVGCVCWDLFYWSELQMKNTIRYLYFTCSAWLESVRECAHAGVCVFFAVCTVWSEPKHVGSWEVGGTTTSMLAAGEVIKMFGAMFHSFIWGGVNSGVDIAIWLHNIGVGVKMPRLTFPS